MTEVLTAARAMPSAVGGAWQEVAHSSDARPNLPRSGCCAVVLPTQHIQDVLIFGGYTEDEQKRRQATNEAWLFSTRANQWTPVVYAGSKIPRVRLVSQAVVVGNSLYVIGGWDPGFKQDGGEILSDVWRLDLASYEWTEVHVELQANPGNTGLGQGMVLETQEAEVLQGMELQPVSRHQSVAIGSKIYIHTHRNTQDILCLDVAKDPAKLSSIPILAPQGEPASRGLHSMTAIGNSLYIYGGAPKAEGMLGDLWELDLEKANWLEVDADGRMPHVRCSHGAAAQEDKIYFFGGSFYRDEGGLRPLNDLFAFDRKEGSWQHPASRIKHSPLPRNAHSLLALPDGRLLVYGGWNPFQETYNDTHVLDPSLLEWSPHLHEDSPSW